MEGIRGTEAGGNQWRLSKLYSDAKQSYRSAIPSATADDVPELQSANRKFRMQKDRLIAWGLEWADSSDASLGNLIGETVEKAGLTEVVSSVLENIIGMIDEVEKLRLRITPSQPNPIYPLDKIKWDASDIDHYKDLVRDITGAIDLLCDLSKSKKPTSRSGPTKSAERQILDEEDRLLCDFKASQASEQLAKALQSQEDPAPVTAQRIERTSLIMPEESSPPYDSFGMPCPVQIVGRMRMKGSYTDFKGNDHYETTPPVLVEYARFDPIYQGNAVPLPFTRLNQLSNLLKKAQANPPSPLLDFIGYFEDSTLPRVGLVYQLPQWAQVVSTAQPSSTMKPESLHALLQTASQAKPTPAAPVVNPPLEDRFILASELLNGFSHLLDSGFAHKDINSTSVAFFPGLASGQLAAMSSSGLQYMVRKPFICGYDLFSEYDIDRERENLHQNIYRHPDDPRIKGPNTNEEYHPRYDMYSLGLLLLEIGLWAPLAKMFKDKYSLKDFSLRLKKIWVPRLASECGSVYMRAVQGLFDASADCTIGEAGRKDCLSRICARLRKCCLLDDEETDGPPADYTPLEEEPRMYTYHLSEKHPIPDSADVSDGIIRDQLLPVKKPQSAPFEIQHVQSPSQLAPPGAWPDVPIFPDFEITNLCSGSITKKSTKPARYLFPECPILKAVCKEAYRIEKRLCKIGERVLDPQESASISLDGFGESEIAAKPTFCVMCSSTAKFYKAVKKNLAFDNNVFDLIIFRGAVARSKAVKRSAGTARRSAYTSNESAAKNPDHHARPLCGASIGAWKDYEHLPPVSFGGVILVDDQPYGMSVHHMLEAPDADDDDDLTATQVPGLTEGSVQRSSARNQSIDTLDDFADDDDDDTVSLGDSDVESITFSDVDEDEADDSDGTPDSECDEGLFYSEGDTVGISPSSASDITITQPALDDVAADFFPVEEDKDDDHLTSHSLGYVHASSGIRRITHNGVDHEIDWALMRLSEDRLQPHNVVAGGRRFCRQRSPNPTHRRPTPPALLDPICRKPYRPEEDHYPTTILPSDNLSERQVHSVGRTSGLANGQIGCFMEFVKMSGRRTWSESWTVRSGLGSNAAGLLPQNAVTAKMGAPGDSGAWIIDNESGKVCGHVLAFSSTKQIAYIAPMEVLLHDIQRTLSAQSIRLPGGERITAVLGTEQEALAAGARAAGDADDDSRFMAEEFARVRLDNDRPPATSRLYAQHFLSSPAQTHLEKEWANRRAALGMECRAGG